MSGAVSLPDRVVVDANGAYWRDFGTHYSMCPVSDDNDAVQPVAVYSRSPELQAEIDRLRAYPHRIDPQGTVCGFCRRPIAESGDYRGGRYRHAVPHLAREAVERFRAALG